MKSRWQILFAVVVLTLAAAAAGAQTDVKPPTIEVTSKAEITVEPDSATISVDYTKTDKDLEAARKANEAGVAKMLAVAKKYGIKDADIRTRNISVEMKYISTRDRTKPIYDSDGDEIGTREFVGYQVSRSVTVVLKDLKMFDEIFNDILRTGPTEIEKVEFETAKLIELRKEARVAAMKAAYEKAMSMAGAIGQSIGKAIKISEGPAKDTFSQFSSNFTANYGGAVSVPVSAPLGTFSAGSITVEATVTITFLLN